MDVEGFFQGWVLTTAVITGTGAAALVVWKLWKTKWVEAVKDATSDAIGDRIDATEFMDRVDVSHLVELLGESIRMVVGEELQTKLDNGSAMRRAIDRLQSSADRNVVATHSLRDAVDRTAIRLASIDLRVGNVERQLENVITEELPQITALAEAITAEQTKVAQDLDDEGESS